jgi:deoxycytidylate deaminase
MMIDKLSSSWKRGFETARAVSIHSNGERAGERMGAALFCGAKLISTGFNTYGKTHPASKNHKFISSIHAEHAALIKRQHYEPSGNLILYVYRETHRGVACCSKPCVFCETYIREAGVRRVRYVGVNGEAEEMKL